MVLQQLIVIINRVSFKLITVGDGGVGKTSLINCILGEEFRGESTLKCEFGIHSFDRDGDQYALQLWDTNRGEYYQSVTRSYFRAAIVLLMFDLTNPSSL